MSLIELVSEKVELRPTTGGDMIGLCPFHLDSKPSFRVNATRYRCFGCGENGTEFSWRRHWGMALPVPSSRKKKEVETLQGNKERILETNRKVQAVFKKGIPKDYLKKRFGPNYREYGLGLCPSLGTILETVPVTEAIEAGLLLSLPGSNQLFCPLAERLTIPVKNASGQILGFIGRALPESSRPEPKYVNPRTNAAFKASSLLFGIHKLTPYQHQTIYVTEGPLDAFAFWSHGLLNAVSVLGSNISEEQVVLLASYTKHVTLCFDGDLAGLRAAYRLIPRLLWSGFNCDIMLLDTKDDPDVRFLNEGIEWLNRVIKVPIHLFLNQRLIVSMTKQGYDRTLLDELTAKYVKDNIQKGYQHLNCIPYVLSAFPHHSNSIKQAVMTMCSDLEETPRGLSPKKEHILNFIREWIKPCREIRKLHAKEENQQ